MPETTDLLLQEHVRMFFQFGGPSPLNPLKYYGTQAQYAYVQGASKSYGSINPIYVPSPGRTGGYTLAAKSREAPDLPEATLQVMQRKGSVPRELGEDGCSLNLYLVIGSCGNDLSDPLSGWNEYVEVYAQATAETVDFGDRMDRESSDPLMDEYSLKLAAIYKAGPLTFGEQAAAQIDREIIDVAYGTGANCANCGPANDGTRRLYAITAASGAGSPGLPAQVIYVERNPVTGAVTVREYDITGLTATTSPTFIDVMGSYLIVGVKSTNSYYYAQLDSTTGVPGAFTQVTSGFVATKTPNDIYVKGSSEAYIAADGGYVYKLTDVTSGVTVINAGGGTTNNLSRIHGNGNTIVAVGAGGKVLRSVNNGDTWAITTSDAGASNLTAVFVKTATQIEVGNAAGLHYTTDTGGASWTSRTITGATSISDIVYATDEVGYIAYNTGTAARLQATVFGGGPSTWADSGVVSSRLPAFPSFYQVNRLAVPKSAGVQLTANTLAVGGIATSAANGDGALYTATTAFL